MYWGAQNAFCFRTRRRGNRISKIGISRTNTLITMIGIRRAQLAGFHPPIAVDSVISALRKSFSSFDKIGDVGLYLWLSAMYPFHDNPLAWPAEPIRSGLRSFRDAREHRTMELAWFLSGLAEVADRKDLKQEIKEEIRDVAMRTSVLIRENQEASGLFRHMSSRDSVAGRLRSHIGSFADQIYPIYALSRFAEVFGLEEGIQSALSCANRVCELQGPKGQWWWHYEAVRGRVIGHYPVYSVHQDAMAPMALFALGKSSGKDFSYPVFKGLNWITGQNELGTDMRDKTLNVIWRNIRQSTVDRYVTETRQLISSGPIVVPSPRLSVLFECHPYHLGWILFAFAGR